MFFAAGFAISSRSKRQRRQADRGAQVRLAGRILSRRSSDPSRLSWNGR